MLTLTVLTTVASAKDTPPPGTAFEKALLDMPANSWLEVPNSQMKEVCAPDSFGVRATMGCIGITEAWGGGAYAPGPRLMLVWGGGHNDYWGNEIYAFDLRGGRWTRLTDPSPGEVVKTGGGDPLPDGRPNSRHTYGGLAYLEHVERLFAQGGAVSPGGGGSSVTWLFDPSQKTWHNAGSGSRPGGYGLAAAYDKAGHSVIVRAARGLWRYDVDHNAWTQMVGFGYRPLWPRYEVGGNKTAAIDSRRQLFWSVGNNDFLVWDIVRNRVVSNDWVTQGGAPYSNAHRLKPYPDQVLEAGGGEIHDAQAPGFDYDSKADQFVAWKGGAPMILDLATKTWKAGSATGAPPAQARNGTYGRWRYLPEYNVFILVNSVTSNVFFYKNTAGGPRRGGS
ncbi:hypothetical protein dqs_3401 [Azoarcus olearius]|uniref:hypothetical protein n=1 Tax=Azoarcus sp. (strain BH72) TaxID=418699 RepID=UPI0008061A19|nr:hypothetical protein [Azoarcus olearius]ANQ86422.1 hypothetical protein dqs_3401 [Azoarcus olearius]